MLAPICHIGLSGWSYRNWAGFFYPRGLEQSDWLAYYARRYSTVEINSSFYGPPSAETVDRWRDAVPEGFVFAVKLWRRITHERHLIDAADDFRFFDGVMSRLGQSRGPLLIQLPPGMKAAPNCLNRFLARLDVLAGPRPWRIAVEFRHPSWLIPEVRSILHGYGAAACISDWSGCTVEDPGPVGPVYIRRHGSASGYRGGYSDAQLDDDAHRIRACLVAGRDVYVYFNNGLDGHALPDANRLLVKLGLPTPSDAPH